MASGSGDRTIKIWNTDTGSEIRTIVASGEDGIGALAVLQNGFLVSGSRDSVTGGGHMKIWNANDGSLIKEIKAHAYPINCLAVLDNGYFASGSNDGAIKIWG